MGSRRTESPEDPRGPFFTPPPPRRRTRSRPKPSTPPAASGKRPQRPPAGRPERTGRPARSAAPSTGAQVRLTGRGGVLAIIAACVLAALTAEATGWTALNGYMFVTSCVVAALLVRPGDLLSLTVSPPLAYFTAAVLAESLLTLGSDGFARGLAIGLGTRLADVAPWLFLGTALVLLIAVFRGLPANFRDFSDQLNGRRPRR
ncbi:DUF6542 domain-containing protein [Nocardiopsis composta]|uniref:DUF6542 domain-containing protein n=1 Tax=Nocardiopsis composta TaxID=157465 RepID=UPI00160ABA1D|nr:DUF6542 domain-containing protein [Nocardiopsis composta]